MSTSRLPLAFCLAACASCSTLFGDSAVFAEGPNLVPRVAWAAVCPASDQPDRPEAWKLTPLEERRPSSIGYVRQGFDRTYGCYAVASRDDRRDVVLILMDRGRGATLEDDRWRGAWSHEEFLFQWYR